MRMWRAGAVTSVAMLLVITVAVGAGAAQPGDLDPTFGGGTGRVFLPAGRTAVAVAVFNDDRGRLTVVAGVVADDGSGRTELTRLTADGALDPSFGEAGRLGVDPTAEEDRVVAADRAPDGTIVVLARRGSTGYSLMRFDPDGRVDRSFGTDGVATGRFAHRLTFGDVKVQPDGAILVLGTPIEGDGSRLLRRHLPDGSKDRAFGVHGSAAVPTMLTSSLVLRPDGRIVVTGTGQGIPGRGGSFVVARQYSASGVPDRSFGMDGLAILPVHPSDMGIVGTDRAALGPGGRIAVSGVFLDPQHDRADAVVAVFTSRGRILRSFDGDGWARIGLDRTDWLGDVAFLPDGRLVAVGGTSSARSEDWGVHRGSFLVVVLRSDGSPEPTFGDGSIVATPVRRGKGFAFGWDLLVGPTTITVAGTGGDQVLVARYLLSAD
jgi:uncharacterized delta-60 repeat protein